MIRLIKGIIVLTLLIVSVNSYSQGVNKEEPHFRGKVILSGDVGSITDSIYVRWYKPYFISGTLANGGLRIVPDQEGNFSFKLPMYDQPYTMQIYVRHKDRDIRLTEFYFVEHFDNILVEIIKNNDIISVKFHGSGAEKYNMATQLDKLMDDRGKNVYTIFKSQDELALKLSKYNQLTKEYAEKKEELIKNSKLSDKMKRMINYEYGQIAFNWNFNIYNLDKEEKAEEHKAIIKKSFNKNKEYFKYKFDTLMNLCPSFLQKLALQESIDLSINSTTDTVKLTDIYQRLKTKYSGKVRDIMLANFFTAGKGFTQKVMRGYDKVVFDSLAKEAVEMVKLPSAKKRLVEQLRLSRGAKVPETSFTDLQGNHVSLASLKGKVVMLDLWSTGCSACARFHQWFHKEIYPIYKENKDFIYLSINGDKTNERWYAALKTGRYSSDDYVNLNIGPKGSYHPFARYYNIAAFPFLMVIGKDGNIYAESVAQDKDMATKILDGALALPLVKSK